MNVLQLQWSIQRQESGRRSITIDYGTGCTGFYDNTRSGKIIINVTGPGGKMGSKRTVTFDDYYFNGIKVEGTKLFENLGANDDRKYRYLGDSYRWQA